MRLKTGLSGRGFTLIEAIITLTVIAVLSTMVYVYFGEAFLKSVTPVSRLQHSASLQRVMENITADCNIYPKWRKGTTYALNDYVIPTGFNGRCYKCTGSGTSATTEPQWPISSSGGATVTDNGVTWTEFVPLRNLLPLATLKDRIGAEGSDQESNDYGKNPDGTYVKYHIVRNRFTQFIDDIDQDSDISGANKILKVTLRNENGETMTSLFFSD